MIYSNMNQIVEYESDMVKCCLCDNLSVGVSLCVKCNHLVNDFDSLREYINDLEVIDTNTYMLLSLAYNRRLSFITEKIDLTKNLRLNIVNINVNNLKPYIKRNVIELKELKSSIDIVKEMLKGDNDGNKKS